MRRSLTRPDENSVAPWDRRSFVVVCLLRCHAAFSRESAHERSLTRWEENGGENASGFRGSGKFEPGTKIRQKAANFEPGTDLRRHTARDFRESRLMRRRLTRPDENGSPDVGPSFQAGRAGKRVRRQNCRPCIRQTAIFERGNRFRKGGAIASLENAAWRRSREGRKTGRHGRPATGWQAEACPTISAGFS